MKKEQLVPIILIIAAAAAFLILNKKEEDAEINPEGTTPGGASNLLREIGIGGVGLLDQLASFIDGRYAEAKESERADNQFQRRVDQNWHGVRNAEGQRFGIGDFYLDRMPPDLFSALIDELNEYRARTERTKTEEVPGVDSCPSKRNKRARKRCRRVKDRYIAVTDRMAGDVRAALSEAEELELL